MTTTEEKLLELLDGPYKELRDDNHVDPHRVLVFEEAEGTVEAVELFELPLRYPVGPGGRWSAHDLGELLKDKALLYRQSQGVHSTPHVHHATCNPHLRASRKRNHGRTIKPLSRRAAASMSKPEGIVTRHRGPRSIINTGADGAGTSSGSEQSAT